MQKGSSRRVRAGAATASPSRPFKRESPFTADSPEKTPEKVPSRSQATSGARATA